VHARACAQLTDDFVRGAMPGMQSLDELRAQLLRSTAAQREAEQKERCGSALFFLRSSLLQPAWLAALHAKAAGKGGARRAMGRHEQPKDGVAQGIHAKCLACAVHAAAAGVAPAVR
jgi:hypothetical protein